MTSRPPLGARQHPPRSLSTANAIPQRPPSHRTLSQQFPSGSPTRRGNDGFVDLTLEPDAARHATIPRMASSRLRLEISESSSDMVASPKQNSDGTPIWRPSVPPRGRPQLHFDVPNLNSLSPGGIPEGTQNENPIKAMPLPVRPGQHPAPAVEKSRAALGNSAKKDARPKPYVLEVPTAAPQYPPNGMLMFPLPCAKKTTNSQRPC